MEALGIKQGKGVYITDVLENIIGTMFQFAPCDIGCIYLM